MEQLTTSELKEKISNGENLVLDFYATWCGPCKIMLNNLEMANDSLVKESGGDPKFSFYKFDVDSDMNFAVEMGVRSVPTIKVFKNGVEFYSKSGVISSLEIIKLLN